MYLQENLLNHALKFLQALIIFTPMLPHTIFYSSKENQIHIFTASRGSQDTINILSSYNIENKN